MGAMPDELPDVSAMSERELLFYRDLHYEAEVTLKVHVPEREPLTLGWMLGVIPWPRRSAPRYCRACGLTWPCHTFVIANRRAPMLREVLGEHDLVPRETVSARSGRP